MTKCEKQMIAVASTLIKTQFQEYESDQTFRSTPFFVSTKLQTSPDPFQFRGEKNAHRGTD